MDFNHAKWLVHHSKKDTAVWMMAFMGSSHHYRPATGASLYLLLSVGTLVFGLLQGVFLSVMLSVTLMIYSVALPQSFAMGR